MKKIATITFHSSYNYGSCLQAYALQEYIKKLDNSCEYRIINLRTDTQKEMYKNVFEKKDIKSLIKRIFLIRQKDNINKKEKYFEKFIQEKLQITKEYSKLEALKNENWDYDYYIAGSDQLWNLQAGDFDWANYLEFVESDNKISYAASFGPKAQIWNTDEKNRVKNDLLKFKSISVREQGSSNNVKNLTGIEPDINVDPTMLLTKEEWEKLIPNDRQYKKGEYIFLYNLKKDKEIIKIAKFVSDELKLPVVISNITFNGETKYGFKKQYDSGPIEFLNLIMNAKVVLSSSFHGTIFAILLNRPFFAINGMKDFRIHTLLEKMGLENRSIEINDYKEKCKDTFNINFEKSEMLLDKERTKSKNYLIRALDLN